jgi:hypothetical protein
MNHTIKGISIVVSITSMLIVGATSMIPIMQNSFASSSCPRCPVQLQGSTTATTTISLPTTLLVSVICTNCYSATVTVTGNNPQPSSFSISDSRGAQPVILLPGSFAVSVDSLQPTYTGDCKGTISAGQHLTCNIEVTRYP